MQPLTLLRPDVPGGASLAEQPERGSRRRRCVSTLVATGVIAGVAFGAAPAVAATDLCVAANGAVRAQKGTATCAADGTGSVAIAKGDGSTATATGGDHNKAKARGQFSTASAGFGGDNNTAT